MIDALGTTFQVVSAFGVFLAGFAVAIWQKRIFGLRLGHATALFIWHYLFSLFYVYYSTIAAADATVYYFNSTGPDVRFAIGGGTVVYFASLFTQGLGMSYLGVSTLFGLFGYLGLLALAGALREVAATKSRRTRQLAALIVFLPGLSFWSASLGKDSLAFLAAGFLAWAALDLRRRLWAVVIAVLALSLVRIHIAALAIASLAFAYLVSSDLSLIRRVLLGMVLVPVAGFVVMNAIGYAGLDADTLSASDLQNYVEQRQGYNLGGGSSVNIASMSIPMRLFTFFFRPLLFGASGLMGLLVSGENLVVLVLFIGFVFDWIRRRSNLPPSGRLFLMTFVALTWIVLANVTANLGIAIRQKTMFEPALLVLIFAYRRQKRQVSFLPSSSPSPGSRDPQPPGSPARNASRQVPVGRG